jgi:cytochrome P450
MISAVSPAFHKTFLNDAHGLIMARAEALVRKLEADGVVDMQGEFQRLTFDVITYIVFGTTPSVKYFLREEGGGEEITDGFG